MCLWGKKVGRVGGSGAGGKGNGTGCFPEGVNRGWVLCLEAFFSLLQAGILGEVSGEGFSRIFISSPGVSFQGHGLH